MESGSMNSFVSEFFSFSVVFLRLFHSVTRISSISSLFLFINEKLHTCMRIPQFLYPLINI